MSDQVILTAEHITKKFSESKGQFLTACDDINLNVYKGKTLGIVGESGCGKSTFVKLMVNVLEPTEGSILYHGEDITKLKGEKLRRLRQKIQMVFQDPGTAFYPKMKVMDIVTEPLMNFRRIRKSEKEEKAKELLRMVELPEEYIYRFPHNMSGGQRQRVGIARALALEPEIIVCDEATSALDVTVQDSIMELLARLQKEKGISFVFICHDLSLVQAFAHQVAVMYLGNLVEILPGEQVRNHAQHPYTQALLEAVFSVQMDFTKEITSIESEAPSPLHIPTGCPFQTRCRECREICIIEKPKMIEVSQGHKVACHKWKSGKEKC